MRRFITTSLLMLGLSCCALAQETSLFGNEQQPGNRLHVNMQVKMDDGMAMPEAISSAIDASLTETDNTLDPQSKSTVAFDMPLSNAFYQRMVASNSLIEVTKTLIEESPDKAVEVITLGVVLYPDFAQEVLDGALLTGVVNADDALVAALQAGADPTSVSTATAAGATGAAPAPIAPIGAGVGAGGTGGGDTTASTN